jgi:hypothetical protein
LIESLRFWIINLSVSGYLVDSNMRLTDELLAMIDAD